MTHVALVTWEIAVSGFCQHLLDTRKSRQTAELRGYHLRRLGRELGLTTPASVTPAELEAWLGRPTWKSSTARSHYATVTTFFRWAVRERLVVTSPAEQLLRPPVRRGRPRPTPDEAYRHALAIAGTRERLALRLGAECGLRRGGMVALRGTDVLDDPMGGYQLRYVGKGGKPRVVDVLDDLALELRAYGSGYVFASPGGGHLTPAHLAKCVRRLLPDEYTMHSLRHRAGSKSYQVTKDIRATQEFLGHELVTSTQIYTDPGREAVRAAQRAAAAA